MPLDIDSSEIHSLIFIFQVFSPAQVIFAGVGVLLSVRILIHTFVQAIEQPSGGYGRSCKPGRSN